MYYTECPECGATLDPGTGALGKYPGGVFVA